ncbi:hypothetical protein FCK90_08545 [Kocuria coralli]|uniref:RNA polymerase sigma-70 region 2 domain-containing protein n=1 Tax=Kocuria coralli TaxID=1461025 RepID=A0A5J5KZ86_9MICC|nr:sigma factor [Kocuria coralli]KAA9394156.1 hypothetical protein FCK90_08545 [Kocuria coralli]
MSNQMTIENPRAQAQQRLAAKSPQAWEAVLATMGAVTPVIRSVMVSSGMAGDVDDVVQEAILSAVLSADRWDPAKGPLVSWVTSIGKRRAIDHIRRQRRGGASSVVIAGQGGADEDTPVIDVAQASFEDRVLDQDEAWTTVRAVMGQVQLVLRNDSTVSRALVVLVECDGEVSRAARLLGLAEPVVREARRETIRMAIVVHRALQLHQNGAPITVQSLLSCLPDEVGAWTRIVAVEAVRAGGFTRVSPEDVAARTGWSTSTARQRLADTLWLLSVARTIGEHGRF